MSPSRSPRFRRAPPEKPVQLTDRDHLLLQFVHRHRFLRSTHFPALLGGSHQQLLRRLQLLFHHGYLERPRIQLEYFNRGGSRPIVYGLGNKGAKLLKQKYGLPPHLRWNEKNQLVQRIFLEHALAVSDVMVGLETRVRNIAHAAFVSGEKLANGKQLRWRVRVNENVKLGIVPDRVFALEFRNNEGQIDRAYYSLECDRGTMPVIRKNLSQTSMFRKLLSYHATWRNEVHKTEFGFDRFRVLIVTTSEARMAKLIDACQKLPNGFGLFLFCDQATLRNHEDIFSAPWKDGRGNRAALLP